MQWMKERITKLCLYNSRRILKVSRVGQSQVKTLRALRKAHSEDLRSQHRDKGKALGSNSIKRVAQSRGSLRALLVRKVQLKLPLRIIMITAAVKGTVDRLTTSSDQVRGKISNTQCPQETPLKKI